MYSALREGVLGLELDGPYAEAPVAAALMEMAIPGGSASLVVVCDGSVSLYLSNGGGVIGAGAHDDVRVAAEAFLTRAAELYPQASPTDAFPLPEEGRVRFQLRTSRGDRTIEASETGLGSGEHPFSPLFLQGHAVIAAIRENTPAETER